MTQEYTINPKRVMDREVAARIFGIPVEVSEGTFDDRYFAPDPISGKPRSYPIPRFSSDLTATWRVIERFRDWGSFVRLEAVPGGEWECVFHFRDRWVHGTDPVPSMAVCKAALAAFTGGEQ